MLMLMLLLMLILNNKMQLHCIVVLCYMRQAGFEPAHPEITRLKLVVLDHSTIDAKQIWDGGGGWAMSAPCGV